MGPSKTGPSGPFATALVSLGKSGRYQIIRPAEKKNLKKKMTGLIIGPAMAGPTGPFATALG